MISRKTLWIAMAFVALMLAAAVWRISLLPDWTQMPRFGEGGVAMSPIHSAVLFVLPGGLLFSMARLTWRARTATNLGEALRPWQKFSNAFLVPISVILTLMQAFMIARSLGLWLTLSPILFARGGLIMLGTVVMLMNNALPKLPWLQSRFAFFKLDPDHGAKFLRLRGWSGFLIGLFSVLGALFLPIALVSPIIFLLVFASMVAGWVFRLSAKRSQPQ